MNARDLVRDFPWTDKPSIVRFAGKFTREQWQVMERMGVPAFLNSDQLDPRYIPTLFDTINAMQNHPTSASLIKNGGVTFAEIVSNQIKGIQAAISLERASQSTDQHQNQLPRWIEAKNNIELNNLASSFTPAQLNQIERLLDERIRDNTELSIKFLRALVLAARPPNIPKLKECPETTFVELVKLGQQFFFDLLSYKAQPVNIMPLQERLPTIAVENEMNASDLAREFPWANKPGILVFAGTFTREQWKAMETAGVPAIVNSNKLDAQFMAVLFAAIDMAQKHPDVAPLLNNGTLKFADVVSGQLKAIPAFIQHGGAIRPTDVMNWLDDDLCERTEDEMTSFNCMDNIGQCLSDENTRKILSGDAKAIAEASFLPESFAAIKGKDIRQLYRDRQISFSQFEKYITDFAIQPQNQFPRWIAAKNNIELNKLANGFTEVQLLQLELLMDVRIRQETEFSISFLRTLLMEATRQSIQMKECPATIFVELVKVQQQRFLDVLLSDAQPFKPIFDLYNKGFKPSDLMPAQEPLDAVTVKNEKQPLVASELFVSKQQEAIGEVNAQSVDSELRQRKVADQVKEEAKSSERRSSSSPLVVGSTFGGDKLYNKAQDEINPNDTCCRRERFKKCVLL